MTYETRSNPTPSNLGAADDVHGEIIPETRAKQGGAGYQMLTVLAASLALIVAAFGAVFATHTHTTTDQTPAAQQANTHTMTRGTST